MDESLAENVGHRRDHLVELAESLWNEPELGLHEEQSAQCLREELEAAGFETTAGVAGMPTAFVATYGSASHELYRHLLPARSNRLSIRRRPARCSRLRTSRSE